jgi:lysozyme
MIYGFDASSVQGNLPFEKLDPSLRFVLLKAQQGNDGFDPNFEKDMRGALAAGLQPFAYCFAYPLPPKPGKNGRDPKAQAKIFVDRVHAFPEMRGRPLFLDLEWPAPQDWVLWGCTAASINAWCQACAAEVQNLTGIPPVLYTYPWWWAAVSLETDVSWAAAYPLWLAAYVKVRPVEGNCPRLPSPWKDWLFWQWDGDGGATLPNGVDADFCVFNGAQEDLDALVQATPAEFSDFDVVNPLPEDGDA